MAQVPHNGTSSSTFPLPTLPAENHNTQASPNQSPPFGSRDCTSQRRLNTKLGWLITVVLVTFAPLLATAASRAMRSANNNVQQWLPANSPETLQFAEFRQRFDDESLVLVSWDGCTLSDPRLDQLVQLLGPAQPGRDPLQTEERSEVSRYFSQATSGPQMVRELTAPPMSLLREEAIDRLEGIVIGEDRQTTGVVVTLTPEGDANRVQAVLELKRVIVENLDVPWEAVHLAGTPIVNAMVDIESQRAITHWVGLAALMAICVAAAGLRSLRLTTLVFLVAWYCALMGVAQVYLFRGQMNLVLVIMPVLVGLLAMSGAVHLINYYRDGIRRVGPQAAPWCALRLAVVPCTLSAVTTAIGLGSLCSSELTPVRTFGFFAASGTLLATVLLLSWLPVALQLWPSRAAKGKPATDQHKPDQPLSQQQPRLQSASAPITSERIPSEVTPWQLMWLAKLGHAVTGRPWTVLALCGVAMAVLAVGLTGIATTVKPIKFFPPATDIHQDYVWMENKLGPLVTMEIVLSFDKRTNDLTLLEKLELVGHLERKVSQLPTVEATISTAGFVPGEVWLVDHEPPRIRPYSLLESARRSRENRNLEKNREEFIRRHYLAEDAHADYLRITARLDALSEVHYETFIFELQGQVEPVLGRLREQGVAGIDTVYTGIDPVFHQAQRKLLEGLQTSFLWAFILVAIMMTCLLRSPLAGLLSMVPNIAPALTVFGLMGWRHMLLGGSLVDIGSMMTASVALGIAVDDTLHFLLWVRRGVAQGQTRREAVLDAYLHCGNAMFQTTLIAGLGMAMFSFSGFQPVAQFGLMMFWLLLAALGADLLLLPAVLVSPLGSLFCSNHPGAGRPTARSAEFGIAAYSPHPQPGAFWPSGQNDQKTSENPAPVTEDSRGNSANSTDSAGHQEAEQANSQSSRESGSGSSANVLALSSEKQ